MVKMLIRNYLIGNICLALMVIALGNIASSSEEVEVSQSGEDTERVIKLLEEHKVYMAAPKKTFQYFCGPCHGEKGNGRGIYFTIDLQPSPRDLTDVKYMAQLTDDYLLNFISKGSAAMEKSELCPPWGGVFDEDRIKGVIAYLRSLTIAKTKVEEKPAEKEGKGEEGKEVKVVMGEQKGTPKTIIWSVLIILCVVFVFAARNEWKKLGMEETSKK